jgi:hypothetical protein
MVRDEGIVEKHGHMVLGCLERADVSLQDEEWQVGALDRLSDLRIGGMHEGPHGAADALLPLRQGTDVGVNAGIVHRVWHGLSRICTSPSCAYLDGHPAPGAVTSAATNPPVSCPTDSVAGRNEAASMNSVLAS